MKIIYVHHNCFIIEWNNKAMVFDYPEILSIKEREFIRRKVVGKYLGVLISHSHYDHFSEEFLNLKMLAKEFKCAISADVAEKSSRSARECLIVNEGSSFEIWDAKVKAYGSSDLGVSYFIRVNSVSVYFAGDNADWRRKELSPKINELVWDVFSKTIDRVRNENGNIDIVFIDLCEICENLGGIFYVMNVLKPKLIVPMHLRGNTKLLKKIADMLSLGTGKVFTYDTLGDEITYP